MDDSAIEKPLCNVVLIEPEIPTNTGNIGRTCVGMQSHLHLVEPLGFDVSNRQLKRAGLDYWQYLEWSTYKSFEEWISKVENPDRLFFFTTKTKRPYYEVQFQKGDWFIFGKETKGLSQDILELFSNQCYTLPMIGPVRSLNLATTVAVVIYEAFRQSENKGKDSLKKDLL